MIALRPVYPIFEQNRKELGSSLGHAETVSTFRELRWPDWKPTRSRHARARCQLDLKTCEASFDYKSAMRYGFGGRPLAQRREELIRNNKISGLIILDTSSTSSNYSRNY
jgi:hypothetical protein